MPARWNRYPEFSRKTLTSKFAHFSESWGHFVPLLYRNRAVTRVPSVAARRLGQRAQTQPPSVGQLGTASRVGQPPKQTPRSLADDGSTTVWTERTSMWKV